MNNFLDWLKEECLPGVWSKGVQASRSSKSIEKIGSDPHELRFKIITPERILAFEVTLWPKDLDAHCNCGSKVEPCHHIVAVAIALENGSLTLQEGPSAADASPSMPRLIYSWIYSKSSSDGLGKITLKREVRMGDTEVPIPGSLIAWIGGVRSGRITGAIPSLTPVDLKIDGLYANETPSWKEILEAVADLPPLPLLGHPTFLELRVQKTKERTLLFLEKAIGGKRTLKAAPTPDLELLDRGLFIRNGVLGFGKDEPIPEPREISASEFEKFITQELPRLRERFDVEVQGEALPEMVESEPAIKLGIHDLGGGKFSVTPSIEYPALQPNQILKKDLKKENFLIKSSRALLNLAVGTPVYLPASGLLELKNRIDRGELFSNLSAPVSSALEMFLQSETGLSLELGMKERETLMRLLLLKEKKPEFKEKTGFLISQIDRMSESPLRNPPEHEARNLPAHLKSILRDYQIEGVHWLLKRWQTLGGAILADDMGLGKTIQTLSILESPSLVVVPTSLLNNWKSEALRFRPDLKMAIYHGPDRTWDESAEITLTTYSILGMEHERFAKRNWKAVILDEAHTIRNPETRAALASTSLVAEFRLALTGTPIQNRIRDLWSLFQFVAPGLFDSESDLDQKLASPFFLRRTKTQVLTELPPKTYLEHEVELTNEEQSLYRALLESDRSKLLQTLTPNEEISPLTHFEALLRARQACVHPSLIDPERAQESSSKLALILELTRELTASGHSVLIYSQWTKFLDLLERNLKDHTPYFRLDGSTKDRGTVVSNFQNSEVPTAFLLSLHAGGVGLNLVRASHVLFCDPWWNPFVELQAEDRAYRMGQEKPVTIHRIIASNTIETAIRDLQQEKRIQGEIKSDPSAV